VSDKHVDETTGIETTGHEWDGIRELNNPLPRWWVYTFYVTIAWAVAYVIAMPAIPYMTGFTKGLLGASQRQQVAEAVMAAEEAKAVYADKIATTDLGKILDDPKLLEFANAGGASAFKVNCSQCHGTGAQGFVGYPNLNDDDWIWGGTIDDIATSIRYGIRSGHAEARVNDMPAFGRDEILEPAQINDVAEYVLSLSGNGTDSAAAQRGEAIFAEQCVACHGDGGAGNSELGAPNLADGIWLYGGDKATVVASIANSRRGIMPAWEGRLGESTIRQLAVYIHSRGGGR
jgi:cytochrome c oxidase cbb3-type subunit 3